jgi:imidazole glycerol-phosphate synthase subunit HisH
MPGVTLIDYGVGNIRAFANIYSRLNIPVAIAQTASQIAAAERLVLPGVGAFDWAIKRLNESGMRDAIDKQVLEKRVPVIGVCVGMQMMAKSSDEGELAGLGWFDAHVAKFSPRSNSTTPLPHMGWNDVEPKNGAELFRGLDQPRYYFLHSYIVEPANADDLLATTNYGGSFASAIQRQNIYGTQFHPEKSHNWGISLLRNFAEL